ncbi:MAG: selenide, water dikinase SelD [Desulfobacterales bacterium]|nr:selenide, water dikinase SelD [Desulfobacterales bacterium]
MKSLPKNLDPDLLVGFGKSDDAGVYRLNDEMAIVTTADFITPPVNDPYIFGQIAAANAISDVYAMGGKPITCLNLVAFPSKKLAPEVLHEIIAGAMSKITESGAVLAGGHSIEDTEPKFGLSVNGIVHPQKIWTNAGARAGDVLILTKPLGSGVLFNANIKNYVSKTAMDECTSCLTTLNRKAAEIMAAFDVHAATDVTGFALAGHCYEMARASEKKLVINLSTLPIMREAVEMYKKGVTTGVNMHNRKMVEPHTRFETILPSWETEIVFDPQTNGGLLSAVPAEQGASLVEKLHDAGIENAAIIGCVEEVENDVNLVFRK